MKADKELQMTTDYDMFNKLLGNRLVKEDRIKAIRDSIEQVGYQTTVILVNEKYEIIDGQGRVATLKRIAEDTGEAHPVYFIVQPGIGINECIAMNIKMKNWEIYDFIQSYVEQGKKDYVELQEIFEDYKEYGLGITEVAMCLSNSASRNILKPLRDGTYKIKDTPENKTCLDFLAGIVKCLAEIRGGSNYYIPVLVGLVKFDLIDPSRMSSVLSQNYERMNSAYNADDALTELQNIYNWHKKDVVFFRDEYLKRMYQSGAKYKA